MHLVICYRLAPTNRKVRWLLVFIYLSIRYIKHTNYSARCHILYLLAHLYISRLRHIAFISRQHNAPTVFLLLKILAQHILRPASCANYCSVECVVYRGLSRYCRDSIHYIPTRLGCGIFWSRSTRRAAYCIAVRPPYHI